MYINRKSQIDLANFRIWKIADRIFFLFYKSQIALDQTENILIMCARGSKSCLLIYINKIRKSLLTFII